MCVCVCLLFLVIFCKQEIDMMSTAYWCSRYNAGIIMIIIIIIMIIVLIVLFMMLTHEMPWFVIVLITVCANVTLLDANEDEFGCAHGWLAMCWYVSLNLKRGALTFSLWFRV